MSDLPHQRRINPLAPGFAADDGAADPRVAAALASYAAEPGDPGRRLEAFQAIRGSRVLVPVVAVLGEVEHDDAGLAHDKTSDMATALLTGRDGSRALLAFTSLASLALWRDDARPVPVPADLAARSALQEGAAALLVDLAGPVMFAVEGDLLEGLARGWELVHTPQGPAWVTREDGSGG